MIVKRSIHDHPRFKHGQVKHRQVSPIGVKPTLPTGTQGEKGSETHGNGVSPPIVVRLERGDHMSIFVNPAPPHAQFNEKYYN